jgi:RNA polymerase sigma factor (sigma-70 family)
MTATSQLLRIACDPTAAVALDTDGDLLRRYAYDRDETAFAELVRRNGPVVLQTCRSVLGNAIAAEDAFQAVFLDLARKSRRLAQPGSIAGWLHAAAVRTARAARRAERRRRHRERVSAAAPKACRDDLSWREVREMLDTELAALPEAYRIPLVLCYLQGLTYEEAARRIGCPVGALRGRLERGKQRLRRRLARYGLPLGLPVLVLGHPPTVSAGLAANTLATVRLGQSGGPVPAAVAGLVGSPCRFRAVWLLPVLLVGAVLAAGTPSPEAGRFEPPPAPRAGPTPAPSPRTDLFDDPLPDGALARLGTIRCRANVLAFGIEPDGTVVTITGGQKKGFIQTWGPGDDRPRTKTPVTLPDPAATGFPCVDISPDGRYVVGGTATQLVVQKRTRDGLSVVASFDVGQRWRQTFSADGTQLAVVVEKPEGRAATALGVPVEEAEGQAVYVCNVQTKKNTKLEGSAGLCDALCFSGDGTRLVAMTRLDRTVLWDVQSGKKLAEHAPKTVRYWSVDLNPTGGVMAVIAWAPASILFVDPKTGTPIEGMVGPPCGDASWIRYTPDGRTVLIGGPSGIRWWDPAGGKLIRTFEGQTWVRGSGQLSADGKILVSHTETMLLRWNAATGKPLFPAAHNGGHQENAGSVSVTPDGKMVATAGADGIRIWAAATGKPLQTLPTSGRSCRALQFSRDSRFLYAPATPGGGAKVKWDLMSGSGGAVKWDLATGKPVFDYDTDPCELPQLGAESVWLSPDGGTLMTFSNPQDARRESLLTAWDTVTGKRLRTIRFDFRDEFLRGPVVISPDGQWLGAGGAVFPVWEGQGADQRASENWAGGVTPPVFSADSRLVAVARWARNRPGPPLVPAVYEVATGAMVLELPQEVGTGMAFHPDGRSLAVAGSGGLAFWDLAAAKEYANWKSPVVEGARMQYFPDGARLLTTGTDTTSLVWEVPARKKQARSPTARDRTAAAWEALGSADGAKAWAAVWALADDGGAIGFLRDKVKPVEPLAAREFNQLLADLGADEYATRVAAERGLEKAGAAAVGHLRQALKTELTAQQQQTVQRLLGGWAGRDRRPPTGERLRDLRAVAALELIGTVEARNVLTGLARGVPEAVVTREARMALARAGR